MKHLIITTMLITLLINSIAIICLYNLNQKDGELIERILINQYYLMDKTNDK